MAKSDGEQHANFNPNRFRNTLDTLVVAVRAGKILVPAMTRQDKKDLSADNTGPYIVREFLKSDPYHIGHQTTSRLILREAASRVRDSKRLERMAFKHDEFVELRKPFKLPIRKSHTDAIEGLTASFKWFAPARVYAWYFDTESQEIALDVLGKAQLPKNMIFAFAIEVILECSKVGDNIREDLQDELYASDAFMFRVEGEIEAAIKALKSRGSCG